MLENFWTNIKSEVTFIFLFFRNLLQIPTKKLKILKFQTSFEVFLRGSIGHKVQKTNINVFPHVACFPLLGIEIGKIFHVFDEIGQKNSFPNLKYL